MKKKIIILGSTGSIGQNTLSIIKKDKKKFNVQLLSTNKNINKVFQQAREFNVKNIIIICFFWLIYITISIFSISISSR